MSGDSEINEILETIKEGNHLPEMKLVNQTKPNNRNRSKIALNETKVNKTMNPKIKN